MANLIVASTTTVALGGQVVKARMGNTQTDYMIRLAVAEEALYVGTAKFNLVSTQEFSAQYNGTMRVVNDNELQIVLKNQWFTTFSTTFRVEAASSGAQSASVIINYKGQTVGLTNLVATEIKLRFYFNENINVTVYGIQIPATKTVTFAGYNTPGQAYRINITLSTTVTGSLDTFCIRTDYNDSSVTTRTQYTSTAAYYQNFNTNNTTSQALAESLTKTLYTDLGMGTNAGLNSFTAGLPANLRSYIRIPSNIALAAENDPGIFIYTTGSKPFTVPTTGNYNVSGTGINLPLTAGVYYMLAWRQDYKPLVFIPAYSNPSANVYYGTLQAYTELLLTVTLSFPYTPFCAQYQTTDTRQTVNAVDSITLTPIP